jgi:hypothetical protein
MPRYVTTIFQIIGTCFLLATGYFGVATVEFLRASTPYPGVVVENEASPGSDGMTYYAWVLYHGEDGAQRRLKSSVGSSPPAYDIGEQVSVRVAKDGSREQIDSFFENWFLPMFMAIFALSFGGVGFVPAIMRARKEKLLAYLKQLGHSVETEQVSVERNFSLKVNGRSPYYLLCKSKVDGAERDFKSGHIWFDPADAIAGKPIRIWYDPRNPGKYQVDLGFLEAKADQPAASK